MLQLLALLALSVTSPADPPPLPEVVVDRDNVLITTSCRVRIAASTIEDADDNGVIRISGDDLVVEFGPQPLAGAAPGTPLDSMRGIGVHATGRNITVRGLSVHGYRVGMLLERADGAVVEDMSVTAGFGQRLASTPAEEAVGDWLRPHENDHGEWLRRYGAGLAVADSSTVTLRRVTVRRCQNGIVLDRVTDSRLYDNDCSFLSGWGLAMWRSSRNQVSRNAFDFCVRGYSHGVYNRGQDSAGILLFEQCSENVFVENSATHGGDGVFGFAGREALGQVAGPAEATSFTRRGCNDNLFLRNDLSDAVAHGFEMTFSFGTRLISNRLAGNGICGVWGGYSQDLVIAANDIARNGENGYGAERGGVNIEHGVDCRIVGNSFRDNRCGVRLWWDDDADLLATPWALANDPACRDNVIASNRFSGDDVAVELRAAERTILFGNRFSDVGVEIDADEPSRAAIERGTEVDPGVLTPPPTTPLGESRPVGGRRALAGREHILMTEWGPYDYEEPMLHLVRSTGAVDEWRLLGATEVRTINAIGRGPLRIRQDPVTNTFLVHTRGGTQVCPYEIRLTLKDGRRLSGTGTIAALDWTIRLFDWTVDPREDPEGWRAQADRGAEVAARSVDLEFGAGTPGDAVARLRRLEDLHPLVAPRPLPEAAAAALPTLGSDRFGVVASSTVTFNPGTYRIETVSDDGVRVWIGDDLVIDEWTWHPPTRHAGEISFDERTDTTIRIEHFELDGLATLRLRIVGVPDPAPAP